MNTIDSADWRVNKKFMCWHGEKHAANVVGYAESFLEQVGSEKELDRVRIAGLLHDIGLTTDLRNHDGHADRSAEMAEEYLSKFKLKTDDLDVILRTIADHGNGGKMDSIASVAICLADKMDMARDKIRTDAELNYLCRQMLKIARVRFEIREDSARLVYVVKGDFDKSCLSDWKKCLDVPERVAEYLGKRFEFIVSDK